MHIDQPVPDALQALQRHGTAVDELPVRAGGREAALEQQRGPFARLRADFTELRVDGGQPRLVLQPQFGLDRARVRAGADERLVRALAEEEVQRVNQDRLARSGLAGQRVEAGAQFPSQVVDQRQVADAQRQEHGQS